MNQTFTFADRLKSAMEQKHMKQVDLIHAAENGIKWCEHAILWKFEVFEDCGIAQQWNNPGTSESGKIYF